VTCAPPPSKSGTPPPQFDINCGVRLIRTNLTGVGRGFGGAAAAAPTAAAAATPVSTPDHRPAPVLSAPSVPHSQRPLEAPAHTIQPPTEKDVAPVKEELTQSLFDHIPVGVGSQVGEALARGGWPGGARNAPGLVMTGGRRRGQEGHRGAARARRNLPAPPYSPHSQGIIPTTAADLEAALEMGMDWSLRCAGAGGRGARGFRGGA
jgi:hypothetical protein